MTHRAVLSSRIGSRVRHVRLAAGLTVASVSHAAGISRRTLTLIEQGHANPSILVLDRVAAALDVDVAGLVLAEHGGPDRIFRVDDAVEMVAMPHGGRAVLRARTSHLNGPELWTWTLEPGESYTIPATLLRADQLLLVTAGQLTLECGNNSHVLTAGDSASSRTDREHRYRNAGTLTCSFTQVSVSVAA